MYQLSIAKYSTLTEFQKIAISSSAIITTAIPATMAHLTCSLNDTIPSSVTVTWLYNGSVITLSSSDEIIQTSNSTTLLIGNLQFSHDGVYQCVFSNNVGYTLRRDISLILCKLHCIK